MALQRGFRRTLRKRPVHRGNTSAASSSSRSRCCASALMRSRSGACAKPRAARAGARDRHRPQLRRAARRAPAPGAGAAGADLYQVRPGAVDPGADLLPADHRRRARAAAGPGAALFDGIAARTLVEVGLLKGAQAAAMVRRRVRELRHTTPVASASIAQVHFATPSTAAARARREVAVKVLRLERTLRRAIESDLAILHTVARWVERASVDGK